MGSGIRLPFSGAGEVNPRRKTTSDRRPENRAIRPLKTINNTAAKPEGAARAEGDEETAAKSEEAAKAESDEEEKEGCETCGEGGRRAPNGNTRNSISANTVQTEPVRSR